MRNPRWRAVAVAAVAAGLATSPAQPARADDAVVVGVVIAIGLVASDIMFTVYDIKKAAEPSQPDRGWTIAEAVVTTPQAVLVNAATVAIVSERGATREPVATLVLIPTIWITSLSAHGIWASATNDFRPQLFPAGSLAIGANTTLSTIALSRAVRGHLAPRPFGVAAMLLTAPQVALGTAEAVLHPRERGPWIGMAAWSGALLLHGIASTIWGGPDPESEPPQAPSPPPRPRDDKPPLMVPAPEEPKPPLMVPQGLYVVPGVVGDDFARAAGIVVGGTF